MIAMLHLLLMGLAGLQALLMLVDEGIFHRRRGLERFERWGHVADTLLFGVALTIPALWSLTPTSAAAYALTGLASCLVITKDEWIHARVCLPIEHWCHALLFVLHGALIVTIGMLWVHDPEAWQLQALPLGVFAWAGYQHFYWNVYYVRSSHQ